MANNTNLSFPLYYKQQFFDKNGNPLSNGKLYTYEAGTSTSIVTYKTIGEESSANMNTNPIILDSSGYAKIVLKKGLFYKFVLKDKNDSFINEWDNVSSADGSSNPLSNIEIRGKNNEIEVEESESGGVKTFLIKLASVVKNAINGKKNKQESLLFSGSATKTIKKFTQDENGNIDVEFEDIDLPPSVPNVEITSPNDTIDIHSSTNQQTNTKTFEIDVNFPVESYLKLRGISSQNVSGNLHLPTSTSGIAGSDISVYDDYSLSVKAGVYYFKATIQVNVTSVSNVNTNAYIAAVNTGATEFGRSYVNIDNSYLHTETKDISGIFLASSDTRFYIGISELLGNTCGIYNLDIFKIQGSSSSGSGGSGDNDKVAVDADAVAGYLEDVLVSASDLVELVKNGNRLLVNVNTEYSADPKLVTMNESQIDSATDNYGAYALQDSSVPLAWGDATNQTYSWLNAKVYQCMRLSDAQGTINKCNVALCGSFGSAPTPCFNVGIFSTDGTLLGQSGLKFKDVDFTTDEELCAVDMVESFTGSLNIDRNTRYIVMVWTCGLQLAAMDRSTKYNYVYDYTLRQNLEGVISQPVWPSIDSLNSRADNIPYIAFGATPLN